MDITNSVIYSFLALLLVACTASCKQSPDQLVDSDYCRMLANDQILDDNRREVFKQNFNRIMMETEHYGFPQVSFDNKQVDSCKYWAVAATLIHMAQAHSDIFFSGNTIDVFKYEIEKGNMNSDDLMTAFNISSNTNVFCDSLKSNIHLSISQWGMPERFYDEMKFKKCE